MHALVEFYHPQRIRQIALETFGRACRSTVKLCNTRVPRLVPAQRQRLAVRTGMARVHVEFAAVIAFLNQQGAAVPGRAELVTDELLTISVP